MHRFSNMNPNVSKSFNNFSGVRLRLATAIDGSINSFLYDFRIVLADLMFGDHAGIFCITYNFYSASMYELYVGNEMSPYSVLTSFISVFLVANVDMFLEYDFRIAFTLCGLRFIPSISDTSVLHIMSI